MQLSGLRNEANLKVDEIFDQVEEIGERDCGTFFRVMTLCCKSSDLKLYRSTEGRISLQSYLSVSEARLGQPLKRPRMYCGS